MRNGTYTKKDEQIHAHPQHTSINSFSLNAFLFLDFSLCSSDSFLHSSTLVISPTTFPPLPPHLDAVAHHERLGGKKNQPTKKVGANFFCCKTNRDAWEGRSGQAEGGRWGEGGGRGEHRDKGMPDGEDTGKREGS